MNNTKKKKLEAKGWKVGSVDDFLELSPEESKYIEVKLALSRQFQELRKSKKKTQEEIAIMLDSSQSRVAKMEKGDPSVSIDLLIRSLFTLGISKKNLAQIITK